MAAWRHRSKSKKERPGRFLFKGKEEESEAVQGRDRLARGTAYESVLRTCWDSYVGAAVRAAAPDLIVVIGRQVADAIGHTVRRDLGADVRIDAVKQPNAHMSATERAQYRRRVFDLCRAR
jgi:hypothetical protein